MYSKDDIPKSREEKILLECMKGYSCSFYTEAVPNEQLLLAMEQETDNENERF